MEKNLIFLLCVTHLCYDPYYRWRVKNSICSKILLVSWIIVGIDFWPRLFTYKYFCEVRPWHMNQNEPVNCSLYFLDFCTRQNEAAMALFHRNLAFYFWLVEVSCGLDVSAFRYTPKCSLLLVCFVSRTKSNFHNLVANFLQCLFWFFSPSKSKHQREA